MAAHLPAGGGAPRNIRGDSWDVTVSVTANSTTTDVVLKEGFAIGSLDVPSGSSITSITWYAANSPGTALAAKDQDGVAVTQTVAASEHHELPSALAGAKYLMPVGDAAGTIYLHLER